MAYTTQQIFALEPGLASDPDGRTLYNIFMHRGHKVVTTWDKHEGGDLAQVIWNGEVCDFNAQDDAREWIDQQLDAEDAEYFDATAEWSPAR